MTIKHTPGPWKVSEARKNEYFVASSDIDVARMLHNGQPHPKGKRGMNEAMKANARLIAVAPDLLEACQNALETISNLAPITLYVALDDAAMILQLAIAKATE